MSRTARRIVVVGLSSRAGAAIAARGLRQGWSVTGTIRRPEEASAVSDAIVSAAGEGRDRLSIEPLDLADAGSVRSLIQTLDGAALDALVVAAAPFEEIAIDSVDRSTLVSQATVQAVSPAELAIGLRDSLARGCDGAGGAVVFFGDIHARLRPRRGALPYLAGKAMLESMVPLLALELAPVRVFGLAPGVIAWAEDFDQVRRDDYLARVPLGRAGTVDEAATLVESMIESMTYTTGIVIPVDGGRSLR